MATHDSSSISRRGEQEANIVIAFMVLSWFFMALRIWTRTYLINGFGWDDSTMVLAGIVFTLYCAAMLYLRANGGGTHVTSVAEMAKLIKWAIVGEATYIITVMILKISLGIFIARVVIRPWQLWTIYTTVAVNIVSSVASFFYVLFKCGPNLDLYIYRRLANQCTPRVLDQFFAYQQASLSTLTDCIFAILPVFILWNASMNIRSKVSVGLILSLAALGSICSMIRFQYLDGLTRFDDFFWNATNIAMWSTIEPGAGIIAGCLATLRPLVKCFVRNTRSIRSSTVRSAKELSKSFRSNDRSHQHDDADVYAQHDQATEFKADVNKKGENADRILTRQDDEPRPSREGYGLNLDRRSRRTNSGKRSSQPNRSRAISNTCDLDRPLPPIPTDLSRHNDDMV